MRFRAALINFETGKIVLRSPKTCKSFWHAQNAAERLLNKTCPFELGIKMLATRVLSEEESNT